jgi:hypothetical protein
LGGRGSRLEIKAAVTELLQALSRDLFSPAYLHQYGEGSSGAVNALRPTLETQSQDPKGIDRTGDLAVWEDVKIDVLR